MSKKQTKFEKMYARMSVEERDRLDEVRAEVRANSRRRLGISSNANIGQACQQLFKNRQPLDNFKFQLYRHPRKAK